MAPTPPPSWHIAPDRALSLGSPVIMGVVNATPDSFSDGGRYHSVEAMTGHALRLVEEGATIVDVGGESTRPGSERVDPAEQIARVVPFIEQFRPLSRVTMSIDTTRAEVALAALDAGVDIINDISAGREDEGMFALAAERSCGLVLMHRRVPPGEDFYSDEYDEAPAYDDVVESVLAFLRQRVAAAEAAGVTHAAIVIDPGLGFGKSVAQNFELIARTAQLVAEGYLVLGAASRKSFVGAVTGQPAPRDRVVGSVAVTVAQYLAGIRLFRVHDVAAHAQALAVATAIEVAGAGEAFGDGDPQGKAPPAPASDLRG